MYELRYYQAEAVEAAIAWCRKNTDFAVLDLAMGAGKSIIVAKIAEILYTLSKGKRVLCLAPNKELVEQNYEKYIALGGKASIYSASVGRKELREQVVFATEGTFKKIAKKFANEFCAIIVDEAHKVTNTLRQIVSDMTEINDMIRLIGLTATPYQLGKGYIYGIDLDNRKVDEAKDPYYKKLLYRKPADELINEGYLTNCLVGNVSEKYDTSNIRLVGNKFNQHDLDDAFVGKGRLTSHIVADFVARCYDRRAVLIFASTIKHAEEILASLPPEKSALLTGGATKKERTELINSFKSGNIKYMVNVGILTTGFDYPELDAIVIMRPSESAGLYQQMIGRGTRLADGKENFLLLDYTDNIENFFGEGSVFEPKIKAYGKDPQPKIEVQCPDCGTAQDFSHRDGFDTWDLYGYATDEFGDVLADRIPAHHGRRCTNITLMGKNKYSRCGYYWTHKECPECQHKNDIVARFCKKCKHELIDPNKKLKEITATNRIEKSVARVLGVRTKESITQAGEPKIMVWFQTEEDTIHVSFYPDHANKWVAGQAEKFLSLSKDPREITYSKSGKGFITIHHYEI